MKKQIRYGYCFLFVHFQRDYLKQSTSKTCFHLKWVDKYQNEMNENNFLCYFVAYCSVLRMRRQPFRESCEVLSSLHF